jgi:hypothetical protein
VLPLEVTVETNTFFSKVRRVKGLAKSELNPKTLRPARYFEDAHENEFHRIADVSFKKNKTAHLVSTIDGRTWQEDLRWGNDVSDVASAVHLLRAIPMKQGQAMCFDVYGIRRIWRVWGTVLPREHVSTGIGEFEAWHLKGEAARGARVDQRRRAPAATGGAGDDRSRGGARDAQGRVAAGREEHPRREQGQPEVVTAFSGARARASCPPPG